MELTGYFTYKNSLYKYQQVISFHYTFKHINLCDFNFV